MAMGVDEKSSNLLGATEERKSSTSGRSANTFAWVRMMLLAFTVSFLAAGWVPKEEILYSIFVSVYIQFMNSKVFPAVTSSLMPGLFPGRIFAYYIQSAFVLGMLLPAVYVIGAFVQGDTDSVKEAVPSLFLLLAQVHTENYTYTRPSYSVMTRVLVPILYNSRRIFSIWRWTLFLFSGAVDPAFSSGLWFRFGRILAVLQVIIWNYNLFCFLLPIYLPGTIRQYQEVEQKLRR